MPTPKDFLERLKIHFKYEPEIEGAIKSERFSEEVKKEFENYNSKLKEKLLHYNIESDLIVENLINEIKPFLSKSQNKKLKKVAFGKIFNTKINAFCTKSRDGNNNYCIVINEGILMFLHKYGKLVIASKYPNNVVFCNRNELENISSQDYNNWALEIIDNYKIHKAPVGAMVKLNHEGNIKHFFPLNTQELFILAHELGHFFNGDLENENFVTDLLESDYKIPDDNKFYEMEYEADAFAFELVAKVVASRYKIEKKQLLVYVAILFDLMAQINPNAGEKHPSPLDRILNIITINWDKQTSELYLKTYSEEYSFQEFYNIL